MADAITEALQKQTENTEDTTVNVEQENDAESDTGQENDAETNADGEGTTVVSFGDEEGEGEVEDKAGAPDWAKELRVKNREQAKRIKELEKKKPLEALGEKPTLESMEFDATAYETAIIEWLGKKSHFDQEETGRQNEATRQANEWQGRLGEYESAKVGFEAKTYTDAEETVKASMNDTQQGILVHVLGAKLAPLIMGLGANDKQLRELAAIKDNALFAAAVGKLEGKMKVTKRKPVTKPESRVSGGQGGVTNDNTLETLRAKAEKTGDYTDVMKFRADERRRKEA